MAVYSLRLEEDCPTLQDQLWVMNSPGYPSYGRDTERGDGSSNGDSRMSPALLNNIRSWCKATGQSPATIVHFKGRTFQLHKLPLATRSGYLKRLLTMNDREIRIPDICPGNPDTFDIVANFCYGSQIQMESSNVVDLRCTAEFLQMGEEYGTGNLCERSGLYLNQVALQSWQDTMVALLRCPNLLPYAEDLGLVNRCVESLAFLACIEMMDRREQAPSGHHKLSSMMDSQFWSDISACSPRKAASTTATTDSSSPSPDWWMDDLLRLPCGLFERVIRAIRREGMQEKFVSQAIVKFVDRWVFTSSGSPYRGAKDATVKREGDGFTQSQSAFASLSSKSGFSHDNLVEVVVRLLPEEKDTVPISFLFSLLWCALARNSGADCRNQLESRIACQLELATISDFLYPFKVAESGGCSISAVEVSCMRRIVNTFMTQQRSFSDYSSEAVLSNDVGVPDDNFYCAYVVSAVAKVWDEYLAEVARQVPLTPAKFVELAEVIPSYARGTHDHLYRAIHVYLKVYPHFSQEERQLVCGILNCQKLSPKMCSHVVQNKLMPLRIVVQAMFMQQLQTRNMLSGNLKLIGGGAGEGGGAKATTFDPLPHQSTESWRRRRSSSYGRRISMSTGSFRSSRESLKWLQQHPHFRDGSFSLMDGDDDDDNNDDGNDLPGDVDDDADDGGTPLGYMMKREAAFRQAATLKADYLATESRLQNLEQELALMKKKMGSSKRQQTRHRVSKCTSERFTKAEPEISPVPSEAVATNSDEDNVAVDGDFDGSHDTNGDVKFSARAGNGLGFLTRALRVITLGGFGRRKLLATASTVGGEEHGHCCGGSSSTEDGGPVYSMHMLCGGRGILKAYKEDSLIVVRRPKRVENTAVAGSAPLTQVNQLVTQSFGFCR